MKYLSDKSYTLDRIHELAAAVEFARYELAAALDVAKPLGITWKELGDRLGMTAPGASQFAKRQMRLEVIPDEEVDRLCRFLGIGDKAIRYEVREVIAGRKGVTAVTYRTVSQGHLSREVAERIAVKRGDQAEVWSVAPDGTSTHLPIRPEHRRLRRTRPVATEGEHVETPF